MSISERVLIGDSVGTTTISEAFLQKWADETEHPFHKKLLDLEVQGEGSRLEFTYDARSKDTAEVMQARRIFRFAIQAASREELPQVTEVESMIGHVAVRCETDVTSVLRDISSIANLDMRHIPEIIG